MEQAHAMGKAGVANTKYDSYLIPLEGWEDKFDDATPSYTSTYSMFLGAGIDSCKPDPESCDLWSLQQ